MARSRHQNGGRWIRRERRLAIYLRDGFRCLVCLCDLHGQHDQITLDHVVSRSRGGSHHERNLYTCCRRCNSDRRDLRLRTWLHRRSGRIAVVTETSRMWVPNWRQFLPREIERRIARHRARKLDRYRRQAKEILRRV